MAAPLNSTLQQVTSVNHTTTTTQPSSLSSVISGTTPAVGNSVTSTSDICSMIYQEGAQDQSCNVMLPSGELQLQCYNPACYTCTGMLYQRLYIVMSCYVILYYVI